MYCSAGEVLHCVKTYVSSYHDRDQLLAAAFKGIGGLPRARIAKLQQAEAAKVMDGLFDSWKPVLYVFQNGNTPSDRTSMKHLC